MSNNASDNSAKPVMTFRYRGISAAIFENRTARDGDLFHKVQIARTYKDGDKFRSTNAFTRADLPVVAHVTQKAYDFILQAEQSMRKEDASKRK